MAHRVNFTLEDSVCQALKQVDKGERSKVVNSAIAEWLKMGPARPKGKQDVETALHLRDTD